MRADAPFPHPSTECISSIYISKYTWCHLYIAFPVFLGTHVTRNARHTKSRRRGRKWSNTLETAGAKMGKGGETKTAVAAADAPAEDANEVRRSSLCCSTPSFRSRHSRAFPQVLINGELYDVSSFRHPGATNRAQRVACGRPRRCTHAHRDAHSLASLLISVRDRANTTGTQIADSAPRVPRFFPLLCVSSASSSGRCVCEAARSSSSSRAAATRPKRSPSSTAARRRRTPCSRPVTT